MARIVRSEENIVPIPMSVSVGKQGYVYANIDTFMVNRKNGEGRIADHKKVCVGKALHPGPDWAEDRRMYANQNYYRLYHKEDEAPEGMKPEKPLV